MNSDERTQTLEALADRLRQRPFVGAARLLLDVVEPVDFLASQLALFAKPLTPRGRWHTYVDALCDESGWKQLRRMVDRHEC